jgi:hypothetical protein
MKIAINKDLQQQYQAAQLAYELAKEAAGLARSNYCSSLERACALQGLGKRAKVAHVHADAHHGNTSDKEVVSEVANVWCSSIDGEPILRIRLGSVKGGLSSSYANIRISNVLRIEEMSSQPFTNEGDAR